MDIKRQRILISAIAVFIIGSIAAIIYYIVVPQLPSTQQSSKTVIIDNYRSYTAHISPDAFGSLGNYLYGFIKSPSKSVYHGTIVNNSYTYSSNSWFSHFVVAIKNSSVSLNVTMQTVSDGSINGDIKVSCNSGGSSCLDTSSIQAPAPTTLQAYLPITTNDYVISTQASNPNALSIVYYDQAGTGKTEALDKIKSLGFDPNNYSIQYYYGGH